MQNNISKREQNSVVPAGCGSAPDIFPAGGGVSEIVILAVTTNQHLGWFFN